MFRHWENRLKVNNLGIIDNNCALRCDCEAGLNAGYMHSDKYSHVTPTFT